MGNNIRIAASAIVIHEGKILLNRCRDLNGGSFLVGPGGGAEGDEDLFNTVEREVWEETRLKVHPNKMLFVEDLLTQKYRMLKFWFLCDVVAGSLTLGSQEALDEGIIEIAWYSKEQLKNEVVYPSIVMEHAWDDFGKPSFETQYVGLKRVNF